MIDLRQRRKELGLTMKQVADAVGFSEATISRYESGNIKNMRRDRLDKYARILKVDILDMIDFEEWWDMEAEQFAQETEKNATLLIEYLKNTFDDENEREIIFNLILQFHRLNFDGLKELEKRLEELCRLEEYMGAGELYNHDD
ncbi:MAG: helix-turn-helix domain-containing protein [Oscillospiraceae bacterium]|nr:helix-turn-helix domain-containing protein [Oscillospiraceae bacterium]